MMNIQKKTFWTIGLIALGCMLLAGSPATALAQDLDGDGLDEAVEQEGIELLDGFDLWNGSGWITEEPIRVEGLSATKPDLFVIWREADPTNIDLAECDIFAFGTKPLDQGGLGFNIWVLREKPNFVSEDRRFAVDASGALLSQNAVILAESLSAATSITGFSEYGSIAIEGKGKAVIYSQNIVNRIEAARLEAVDGKVKDKLSKLTSCGYGQDNVLFADDCLECQYFKDIAIHEVLHVMVTLENDLSGVSGHHIKTGTYIMKQAVVWKLNKQGKALYTIPNVSSPTTQTTWTLATTP